MIRLDVTIMGQSYTLTCTESEEGTLREAIAYLDSKMCAIRDAGKIKGNDRIAVMASIAIAAELLLTQSPQGPFYGLTVSEVKQNFAAMNAALDAALAPQENLF
jgi:cell division protein ZapA